MRPGEIYLAQFPFGDVPGMKLRPVLLLTGAVGSVPEVLVSYISSVIPSQLLPSDLVLDPAKPEFRSTNLKTLSTLRLHKLATKIATAVAEPDERPHQLDVGVGRGGIPAVCAAAGGGAVVPEPLRVAPLQVSRGQFECHATAHTLQPNARRHDADGLIEKIHFVFAGDVTRLAWILLK